MSSDFWASAKHHKARKEHKCVVCHRMINIGEVYYRGFGVYDGWPNDFKLCAHCEACLPVIEWDESYSEDDFDYWEPANVEQLRAKVHYRKRWRNKAGELYPIPSFQEGKS